MGKNGTTLRHSWICIRNNNGFSLVELIVGAGLLGIMLMAMLVMYSNQLKSNNFLEFQAKKEQMRLALLGQVLNNPNNCRCLFAGANQFPVAGIAELTGFAPPPRVGKYEPADCSGGVPAPLVDTSVTGIDGLKLSSVKLKDILLAGGTYGGNFVIELESVKQVIGPSKLAVRIPVNVQVTAGAPGNVVFAGCSLGQTGIVDLPAAPNIACETPWPAVLCSPVTVPLTNAWRNIDLTAAGVPASAKAVHFRIFTAESSVHMKRPSDPSPPNFANRVAATFDDANGTSNVRVDLTGTNGRVAVALVKNDPPTYAVSIEVIAYEP